MNFAKKDQRQMQTKQEDEMQPTTDQQLNSEDEKNAQNDGFRYDYDDSSDL